MRRILCLFLLGTLAGTPAIAAGDLDGDGLPDATEDANGNGILDAGETDWRNADTDDGGESDGAERAAGRDPLAADDDSTADPDDDGLVNGQEKERGTDPGIADTDADGVVDGSDPFPLEEDYATDADGDGLPDEWEKENALSTVANDADIDTDGDQLSNRDEFARGTDPRIEDSDRDGTGDGDEVDAGTDPQENACLSYAEVSAFSDTKGHWGRSYARILRGTAILPFELPLAQGYPDGDDRLFLPDRPIAREELLKLAMLGSCIRLLGEEELTFAAFPDLPAKSRPHASLDRALRPRIAYTAVRLGIVQGYGDGTFRPEQQVTRAEALKMLMLAHGITPSEPSADGAEFFTDVPAQSWFAPYVTDAVALDLVEGYGDGTFRPDAPVTRAEAAKLAFLLMIDNPSVNGYVLPLPEKE